MSNSENARACERKAVYNLEDYSSQSLNNWKNVKIKIILHTDIIYINTFMSELKGFYLSDIRNLLFKELNISDTDEYRLYNDLFNFDYKFNQTLVKEKILNHPDYQSKLEAKEINDYFHSNFIHNESNKAIMDFTFNKLSKENATHKSFTNPKIQFFVNVLEKLKSDGSDEYLYEINCVSMKFKSYKITYNHTHDSTYSLSNIKNYSFDEKFGLLYSFNFKSKFLFGGKNTSNNILRYRISFIKSDYIGFKNNLLLYSYETTHFKRYKLPNNKIIISLSKEKDIFFLKEKVKGGFYFLNLRQKYVYVNNKNVEKRKKIKIMKNWRLQDVNLKLYYDNSQNPNGLTSNSLFYSVNEYIKSILSGLSPECAYFKYQCTGNSAVLERTYGNSLDNINRIPDRDNYFLIEYYDALKSKKSKSVMEKRSVLKSKNIKDFVKNAFGFKLYKNIYNFCYQYSPLNSVLSRYHFICNHVKEEGLHNINQFLGEKHIKNYLQTNYIPNDYQFYFFLFSNYKTLDDKKLSDEEYDTMINIERFNIRINKRLSAKQIVNLHNEISEVDSFKLKQIFVGYHFIIFFDKLKRKLSSFPEINNLEIIEDGKRLQIESKMQKHCVNTYDARINNGECCILSFLYENKRYTMQISSKMYHKDFTNSSKSKFTFYNSQIRGKANSSFENRELLSKIEKVIDSISVIRSKDKLLEMQTEYFGKIKDFYKKLTPVQVNLVKVKFHSNELTYKCVTYNEAKQITG